VGLAVGLGDRAAERDGLDVVVQAGVLELAEQHVEVEFGGAGRLPLQGAGDAGALVFGARAAIARDARGEGARARRRIGDRAAEIVGPREDAVIGRQHRGAGQAERAVGGVGALGRRGGRVLRRVAQRRAEAAVGAGRQQFDRLVAFLDGGALGIGHRDQGPEVAPGVGIQTGEAGLGVARQVVVERLGAQGDGLAAIVERPAAAQVDRRAQRAFLDIGRRGLAHLDRVEQLRGEDAEVEARTAVGAAVDVRGAGGGDAFDAVDPHAGEAGVEAAHGDLLAFAAVAAGQRDAGNALQGLGQVGVGELGDVLGLDHVDDAGLLALDVEGAGQAGAEAGDHHFLDRVGVGRSRRLRGVLGVSRRQQGGGGENRQEQPETRRAARIRRVTMISSLTGLAPVLVQRARTRFLFCEATPPALSQPVSV
jgi:hypothetical protein